MARKNNAPKKQLWEQMKVMGRPRTYETAKMLWEAACDYFAWCDRTPIIGTKPMVVDKTVEHVEVELGRPYTMQGLCIHLGVNDAYLRQLRLPRHKGYEEFSTVLEMIDKVLFEQKFSGASVGVFNANIIARELGLTEKTENKNENINYNSVPLSKEEVKDIKKKLDSEY